eukprot:TRINITY_DN47934_c0_g1_i1.p1 TRINITY_DN47934_c0_g1~~TRINITY_DN47934_c0_g1_i1.p1  ORF type:complete len:903 (+),score=160.88 TRINITY_DN47934_c0_g1_i1:43-2709(+)
MFGPRHLRRSVSLTLTPSSSGCAGDDGGTVEIACSPRRRINRLNLEGLSVPARSPGRKCAAMPSTPSMDGAWVASEPSSPVGRRSVYRDVCGSPKLAHSLQQAFATLETSSACTSPRMDMAAKTASRQAMPALDSSRMSTVAGDCEDSPLDASDKSWDFDLGVDGDRSPAAGEISEPLSDALARRARELLRPGQPHIPEGIYSPSSPRQSPRQQRLAVLESPLPSSPRPSLQLSSPSPATAARAVGPQMQLWQQPETQHFWLLPAPQQLTQSQQAQASLLPHGTIGSPVPMQSPALGCERSTQIQLHSSPESPHGRFRRCASPDSTLQPVIPILVQRQVQRHSLPSQLTPPQQVQQNSLSPQPVNLQMRSSLPSSPHPSLGATLPPKAEAWVPLPLPPMRIVKSRVTSAGAGKEVSDGENTVPNVRQSRCRALTQEEIEKATQEEKARLLRQQEDIALMIAHLERQEEARDRICEAVLAVSQVDIASADLDTLKKARSNVLTALTAAKEASLPRAELWLAERQRRRLHNAIQDLKGQLRVCCRVRPLSARERSRKDMQALRILDDTRLELRMPAGNTLGFQFNGVFGPDCSEDVTEEIFEDCRDLAQSALDGHNVTLFSYGQTGAGKTYTMFGNEDQDGLSQRMIRELYARAAAGHGEGPQDSSVSVTCNALELYNNHLVDLLRPVDHRGRQNPGLKVCMDSQSRVEIEGLAHVPAGSPAECLAILKHGLEQRVVAQHALNLESSRSHMIFTVELTMTGLESRKSFSSKLTFCDLGGCERIKRTQVMGDLQREAIEINKSLSALGDVIGAVAEQARGQRRHVPYRNHKLTCLLRDAVGGTAKVLMYVCCSPALSCAAETAAALKLASRAKGVANQQQLPPENREEVKL